MEVLVVARHIIVNEKNNEKKKEENRVKEFENGQKELLYTV